MKVKELSKDIICGKTPSTKNEKYWGSDVPFITIPDMHNKIYIIKTERYLTFVGAESQKNKYLPKNSICVSCIATPGLVSLTLNEAQTNQQINSIICHDNISPYYLYYSLKSKTDEIIILGGGGSTTLNLNKTLFSNIKIPMIDISLMSDFNNLIKPIFEIIELDYIILNKLNELKLKLLQKFFG